MLVINDCRLAPATCSFSTFKDVDTTELIKHTDSKILTCEIVLEFFGLGLPCLNGLLQVLMGNSA